MSQRPGLYVLCANQLELSTAAPNQAVAAFFQQLPPSMTWELELELATRPGRSLSGPCGRLSCLPFPSGLSPRRRCHLHHGVSRTQISKSYLMNLEGSSASKRSASDVICVRGGSRLEGQSPYSISSSFTIVIVSSIRVCFLLVSLILRLPFSFFLLYFLF
ncbi:hypothetical protein BGZ63DRAFT_385534 [Mariannaea sp. PMI_226]|nr:hypothetical protein BGZ63DRAFT_385534 [Mariannaea sp. PMI_226]